VASGRRRGCFAVITRNFLGVLAVFRGQHLPAVPAMPGCQGGRAPWKLRPPAGEPGRFSVCSCIGGPPLPTDAAARMADFCIALGVPGMPRPTPGML
jgi:hypothetical protein